MVYLGFTETIGIHSGKFNFGLNCLPLILYFCKLLMLTPPWQFSIGVSREYCEMHAIDCLFVSLFPVKLQAASLLVVQSVLKTTNTREMHSCSTLCLCLIHQLTLRHMSRSFSRLATLSRVMRCVYCNLFVLQQEYL